MSKQYIIKIDSETTGLKSKSDQMLTFAFLIKDHNNNELEVKEISIRLKSNIKPSPKALAVNKINPFSQEYINKSINEYDFVKQMITIFSKYTIEEDNIKYLPRLEAYNCQFDKYFLTQAFNIAGFKLSDYVSNSSIDPMKWASKIVKNYEDDVENKENVKRNKSFVDKLERSEADKKIGKFNTKYSHSLEYVARALDVVYSGDGAHSALSDTRVLDQVGAPLFKMLTGFELSDVLADPQFFKINEVYNVLTDSKTSGLKKRHVKVLKNDVNGCYITVLDEDDIILNKELRESAIRVFSYDAILGALDKEKPSEISLNAYYATQGTEIDSWVKEKKFKTPLPDDVYEEDVRKFNVVDAVAEKMMASTDKKETFNIVYAGLTEELSNNDECNLIMQKAEKLALAKGHEGWIDKLFPAKLVPLIEFDSNGIKLKVILTKDGKFQYKLEYMKDGETYENSDSAKSKPEFKKLLKETLGDIEFLSEFIKDLPTNSDFKDVKSPESLVIDMKEAIEKVKNSPDDLALVSAVNGVLDFYKVIMPDHFKKFKI